jgi:hypothetical protein
VTARDDLVQVEVTDRGEPWLLLLLLLPAGADAEGGRGLELMAGLAESWGWRRCGRQIGTWFVVRRA